MIYLLEPPCYTVDMINLSAVNGTFRQIPGSKRLSPFKCIVDDGCSIERSKEYQSVFMKSENELLEFIFEQFRVTYIENDGDNRIYTCEACSFTYKVWDKCLSWLDQEALRM